MCAPTLSCFAVPFVNLHCFLYFSLGNVFFLWHLFFYFHIRLLLLRLLPCQWLLSQLNKKLSLGSLGHPKFPFCPKYGTKGQKPSGSYQHQFRQKILFTKQKFSNFKTLLSKIDILNAFQLDDSTIKSSKTTTKLTENFQGSIFFLTLLMNPIKLLPWKDRVIYYTAAFYNFSFSRSK